MTVSKNGNYIVRPGKVYFILGLGSVITILLFGILMFIENNDTFRKVYFIYLMPVFFLYAFLIFAFYFKTKILVYDDKLIVQKLWKKKYIKYSEISEVRINNLEMRSRPIIIYHNDRKVIRIVRAYNNYLLFEQDLLKKCAGVINICI